MPRVTVVIPTFNWSTVLPFAIGSVLRQTFTDLELLVVGDGCTDDSEAVVRAIRDPRVAWLNLPRNTGHQSGPNNEGLRRARGELIAYLGHDDLWLPHHLAVLVQAIDRGAGLVYGITELVSGDGTRVEALPRRLRAYRPGMWLPPTGVVHRRGPLVEIGGWRHWRDTSRDPETDLLERLWRAGVAFDFVPRLTAVKLASVLRRDAYRLRASHEQAAWLARIEREPDLEPTELGRLLVEAESLSPALRLRRFWARLPDRLRRHLGSRRAARARIRRFKGLGPTP